MLRKVSCFFVAKVFVAFRKQFKEALNTYHMGVLMYVFKQFSDINKTS